MLNKCLLIGRLTDNPKVNTSTSGKKVARFTLAVQRRKQDESDFISCVSFDRVADLIEKYVAKGNLLHVTGAIRTGSYDGQNGKVYTTDVVVEDVTFLTPRAENRGESQAQLYDDGLPF